MGTHTRAVDAHVGKALFADAIIGALRDRGKAVLLVTHALHFLSQCDTVYTLAGGRIAERGMYAALAAAGGEFARLDAEFGGAAAQEGEDGEEGRKEVEVAKGDAGKVKEESRRRAGAGTGKLEGRLIINEKRTTGSVGWTSEYDAFM
jgi:ATP-binding cassette subfamily C (CFTR/MRP) protein 1